MMHIPLVLEISKIVMVMYRAAMLLHYAHLAVGCVSENVALLCSTAWVHVTMPTEVSRKSCDYWSVHIPAVNCGPLADPVNGVVMIDRGTTFGMTARYSCDAGYVIAGAFALRVCTISGQWSGEAPRCERMYTI